ncbi:MAG: hypothetical protein RL469_324, partial [Pseudomonadota bacterium]
MVGEPRRFMDVHATRGSGQRSTDDLIVDAPTDILCPRLAT